MATVFHDATLCSECGQRPAAPGATQCIKCMVAAIVAAPEPCARCGQEPRRPGQRWGVKCHAAYMRGWRPGHPLKGEALKKSRARSYAGEYQRRGFLVPKPCQKCGTTVKVEKHHHRGYDDPLLVTWLCRKCHLAEHPTTHD